MYPWESCIYLKSLQEAFQNQKVVLIKAPFKLLCLYRVVECEFCAQPLRAESLFPIALWLSRTPVPLNFRAICPGGLCFSSWSRTLGWGAQCGAQTYYTLWKFSAVMICCCCSVAQLCPTLCNPMDCSMSGNYDYPPVCRLPPDGCVSWPHLLSPPLLPVSLWLRLYIFSCRKYFLLIFRLSSMIIVL